MTHFPNVDSVLTLVTTMQLWHRIKAEVFNATTMFDAVNNVMQTLIMINGKVTAQMSLPENRLKRTPTQRKDW